MKKQEHSVNLPCDFLTLNSVNKTKTHLFHKISNLISFLRFQQNKMESEEDKKRRNSL